METRNKKPLESRLGLMLASSKANIIDTLSKGILDTVEDVICYNVLQGYEHELMGLVVVKILEGGQVECPACDPRLTLNDKRAVQEWVSEREKKHYAKDFYRIEFVNYIFLFKEYEYTGQSISCVLIGHLLANTSGVRIDLLEARQQIFMEGYMNG